MVGQVPQFMTVIDNWRTVAMDTHTKYGTWATATHLSTGQIAKTHQIIVAQTIRMSTQASGTFRRPAKIGMNIRLATRLMANGRATFQPTLPRNAWMNMKPKLMR